MDAGSKLYTGLPCVQGRGGGGQGQCCFLRDVARPLPAEAGHNSSCSSTQQQQLLLLLLHAAPNHPYAVCMCAFHTTLVSRLINTAFGSFSCLPAFLQVIPIYGRGSDFDPRQEAIKVQPVPPRPAGQRPSAVQVCCLSAVLQARWCGLGCSSKQATAVVACCLYCRARLAVLVSACLRMQAGASSAAAAAASASHNVLCFSVWLSLLQAGAGGSNQQGVLPALFGFQLGPGALYDASRWARASHPDWAAASALCFTLSEMWTLALLVQVGGWRAPQPAQSRDCSAVQQPRCSSTQVLLVYVLTHVAWVCVLLCRSRICGGADT